MSFRKPPFMLYITAKIVPKKLHYCQIYLVSRHCKLAKVLLVFVPIPDPIITKTLLFVLSIF